MRFIYFQSVVVLCTALVFLGCNSADNKLNTTAQKQNSSPSPQTVYSDGARRITVQEAQDLIKKGELFVVDVRNQSMYDAGHIPGSKLIPEGEIVTRIKELPKDKTILTYCS
jgi:3-mercaptopyruvate sulfurtransferase SseA